jgi:hypothetical protein
MRKSIGQSTGPFGLFACVLAAVLAVTVACAGTSEPPQTATAAPPAAAQANRTLPPVSGLGCLPGGGFLVVTDVKNDPSQTGAMPPLLRVLPASKGSTWEPVTVLWPDPDGSPNDLESVAVIPGTDSFLIVESSSRENRFGRIFQVAADGRLLGFTSLIPPVTNVEGTAVARVGERLVFIDSERGEDQADTSIRWFELRLDPLTLGQPRSTELRLPEPAGTHHRHISALEVDGQGRIFAVSTVDPGDPGPFRSIVWEIGQVEESAGLPAVTLLREPRRLATVDGFKVEALAACPSADGKERLFIGTDDEDYGGAIRPLPDVP